MSHQDKESLFPVPDVRFPHATEAVMLANLSLTDGPCLSDEQLREASSLGIAALRRASANNLGISDDGTNSHVENVLGIVRTASISYGQLEIIDSLSRALEAEKSRIISGL